MQVCTPTDAPFLVVSWTMPPTGTGSSVIVRNLLENFDPEACVLLGQIPYAQRISLQGFESYQRVEIPSYPIHWRVKPWVEPFISVPMAVHMGRRLMRERGLRAVVGVYPNDAMLYAAYLIAERERVPFFPWFHNLYSETRRGPARIIARRLERTVLGRAERVFTMSDGMTRFYREAYGRDTTPLVHPLNLPVPEEPPERPAPKPPYRIGFSGNVNYTTRGAVEQVIRLVGNDPDFRIVFHTRTELARVREDLSVWAENIERKDTETQQDLVDALSECDLLVLGLENRDGSHMESDFATQFPTRTLEMLLSGTPMLALCPRDYFTAQFLREHDCGMIVSEKNDRAVREALERLLTSGELRRRYSRNALSAVRLFRGSRVAAVLADALSSQRLL